MDSHNLVIAFDTTDPRFDPTGVAGFITSDSQVESWWNHIPGLYMVRTGLSARELTGRLKPLCNDVSFLVTEANLDETVGYLPKQSWSWILRRRTTSGTVGRQASEP